MPKFDIGSFLMVILMTLLIAVFILFFIFKIRERVHQIADTEPVHERPTWEEVNE